MLHHVILSEIWIRQFDNYHTDNMICYVCGGSGWCKSYPPRPEAGGIKGSGHHVDTAGRATIPVNSVPAALLDENGNNHIGFMLLPARCLPAAPISPAPWQSGESGTELTAPDFEHRKSHQRDCHTNGAGSG